MLSNDEFVDESITSQVKNKLSFYNECVHKTHHKQRQYSALTTIMDHSNPYYSHYMKKLHTISPVYYMYY